MEGHVPMNNAKQILDLVIYIMLCCILGGIKICKWICEDKEGSQGEHDQNALQGYGSHRIENVF